MNSLPRLLLLTCAGWLVAMAPTCCALTTTYSFSAPPDDVSVTITPGNSTTSTWPTQLLNTRTATENNAGVVFRNEVNNTIFVDSNALEVSNATVLDGTYVWADVQYNSPADEPFIEIDFSNWIGGTVQELQFDFALTADLPASGTNVIDSEGDEVTLFSSTTSFTFGSGQTGAQGSATLSAGGILDDIAKVRFEFADENFAGLQIGFDNFVISNGQSGDFGGNGVVDGADLTAWIAAFGSTNAADADGDGDSDGQDYLIWQKELTNTSSLLALKSVPEPSSLLLGLLALLVTPNSRALARCRVQ